MTAFPNRVVRVFGAYLLTVMIAGTAHSQNKNSEAFSIVTGTVCDSESRPVPNAAVSLESDDHAHKFTVQSESDGRYRFNAVPGGNYELRVIKPGYGMAKNGPFVLNRAESKSVILRLPAADAAASSKNNSVAIEFSDEIHFNVAGV